MNYFNFDNPLALLKAKITENKSFHGYRAQLSEAAGCQRSFLSQVLSGVHHLSLEHGVGLAKFWTFSAAESDYFLDLIAHERAGTPALRKYLKERLASAKSKSEDLKERFRTKELTPADQTAYYASWVNAAVHMLLTIPKMQTPDALAQRLQLPKSVIAKTLGDLVGLGLVEKSGERYHATSATLHLPKDSPLTLQNHSTWRQYALHKAMQQSPSNLHYSSVYSLSKADVQRLQEMVLSFIESTRRLVAPSKEEDVVGLLIDYFTI